MQDIQKNYKTMSKKKDKTSQDMMPDMKNSFWENLLGVKLYFRTSGMNRSVVSEQIWEASLNYL